MEGEAAELVKRSMLGLCQQPAEGTLKDKDEKWKKLVRSELIRRRREISENAHQVHLLSIIAHLRFLASSVLSNGDKLIESLEKLELDSLVNPLLTVAQMEKLINEFRLTFICDKLENSEMKCTSADLLINRLGQIVESKTFAQNWELALVIHY